MPTFLVEKLSLTMPYVKCLAFFAVSIFQSNWSTVSKSYYIQSYITEWVLLWLQASPAPRGRHFHCMCRHACPARRQVCHRRCSFQFWWYGANHRPGNQDYEFLNRQVSSLHDDVIKRKHFPRYWPFVREIHRSPVNFPTKASDAELWFSFDLRPK